MLRKTFLFLGVLCVVFLMISTVTAVPTSKNVVLSEKIENIKLLKRKISLFDDPEPEGPIMDLITRILGLLLTVFQTLASILPFIIQILEFVIDFLTPDEPIFRRD